MVLRNSKATILIIKYIILLIFSTNFPWARESENFVGSNSEQFSSYPDPTPSEPAGIVIISPPGSISSARQQAEDDAPEHHLPANFDQNVGELYSRVNVGDRYNRSKKSRAFEARLDDKFESKIIRDPGEEFGGETVPALDTEVIVDEIETEVIVLNSGDSGEEMADDSIIGKIDLVRTSCELSKDVKSKEEIAELKFNASNRGSETGHESGVGGSDKVAKDGKRIEKIDELRYVGGGGDSRRRQKEKIGRAAPVSMAGIGKNAVETVELKSGLMDFLDVLKVVVGDMDGGCKDDDFLGMAKSRGLTFPRPRWWSTD